MPREVAARRQRAAGVSASPPQHTAGATAAPAPRPPALACARWTRAAEPGRARQPAGQAGRASGSPRVTLPLHWPGARRCQKPRIPQAGSLRGPAPRAPSRRSEREAWSRGRHAAFSLLSRPAGPDGRPAPAPLIRSACACAARGPAAAPAVLTPLVSLTLPRTALPHDWLHRPVLTKHLLCATPPTRSRQDRKSVV